MYVDHVFEAHGPDLIVLANVDGTDPQVIGQSYTNPIITSDGGLVRTLCRYPTTSLNSADVYAINLTQPGACKTFRLTNYNFPQGLTRGRRRLCYGLRLFGVRVPPRVRTSYTSGRSAAIYRVYENGTLLPPVTIPNPYASPWATFHHLKPNPVFPNIVAYLWESAEWFYWNT